MGLKSVSFRAWIDLPDPVTLLCSICAQLTFNFIIIIIFFFLKEKNYLLVKAVYELILIKQSVLIYYY